MKSNRSEASRGQRKSPAGRGVAKTAPVRVRQASDTARTLDRGLQALDLVARNPTGLTLSEVASELDLHRTIVHRLLRTLASHGLVTVDVRKRYQLGIGIVRLAGMVDHDLRTVALPLLQDLADTVGATANITIRDGQTVVVLATVEPRRADAHVAYRAGQTHPIDLGSAGLAILAAGPREANERPEVTRARKVGYAVTHQEVIPGTWGVSAAVPRGESTVEASVGVSLFSDTDLDWVGRQVIKVAAAISERAS